MTHRGGEIGRLHAAATEPLRVRATEVVRREAPDPRALARGGEIATEVPAGAEEKDSPTVSVLHGKREKEGVAEVHDGHDALAVRPLLDHVGSKKKTDALSRWLAEKRPRAALLRAGGPREGSTDARWSIVANETIELDE